VVTAPTLYECRVTHVRAEPITNAFTYPMQLWLTDLDDLPRDRPLSGASSPRLRGTRRRGFPGRGFPRRGFPRHGFLARDHLGDPGLSIRANVDRFLASRGVSLGGGQVLMLTQPRALGYVFNPLTVYWCHRADGALAAVIAEVCNTHGERHCYLLRTDERGRARVAKEFYVSPFYPVDGSYRMSLPTPGDRLNLSVTLHRAGERPFVATVRGHAVPGQRVRPWSTAAVTARIRRQGIGLYLRGLPVLPRPAPDARPGRRPDPRPGRRPGTRPDAQPDARPGSLADIREGVS
jgi:DUF1365 family protein